MALVDDFQQVAAVLDPERGQLEIVQQEELHAGELPEQANVAAARA